jgi:hypothetical protein
MKCPIQGLDDVLKTTLTFALSRYVINRHYGPDRSVSGRNPSCHPWAEPSRAAWRDGHADLEVSDCIDKGVGEPVVAAAVIV